MKLNITLLFASVGIVFASSVSSCKKQLEEVIPQDAISFQAALTDPNATQTLYVGVYTRLRANNTNLFNMGEMRSDIWTDGIFAESADGAAQQLYTHNINVNNVPFSNWGNLYNLMYQINNVLTVLPKSRVAEPNKTLWQAEMYGLRAYIYYVMLRT